MKTYLEKNETAECKCGEQKSPSEIFCCHCANYWASSFGKYHLHFTNSNGSVSVMNTQLNDMFPEELDPE